MFESHRVTKSNEMIGRPPSRTFARLSFCEVMVVEHTRHEFLSLDHKIGRHHPKSLAHCRVNANILVKLMVKPRHMLY